MTAKNNAPDIKDPPAGGRFKRTASGSLVLKGETKPAEGRVKHSADDLAKRADKAAAPATPAGATGTAQE